jgi:hypothetical protein
MIFLPANCAETMARLSAVDGAAVPAFFRIAAEVAALAATIQKAPAGAKER